MQLAHADSVTIKIGDDAPKKGVAGNKGGPPPHAPAHGYRAKYSYYYYPGNEVYFDSSRGLYFYLSGKDWRVSASLPLGLQSNLGAHVIIDMNSDKPYTEHAAHKSKYPPNQYQKKSKPEKGAKPGNKEK